MKNLLSQLGTFVTVTVIALLVWLYAEDANVQSYTQQAVRVQFVLPAGSEGLISPAEPITVMLDFDGSNGQFQQFEAASDQIIQIELPIDPALDLQELNIDLKNEIEQSPLLKPLGVNVTSVTPEIANVTFEKYVEVTLDISIRQRTGPINLSNPPTFTTAGPPPRVTLAQVPAGLANRLGNISALAWINQDHVESLEKGVQQEITVDLELPGALANLDRDISEVDLFVTVADDRDTVKIDRRTVLLSYPPSINERYIVELEESDRVITAFELEGPRDQIALLRADPASKDVWASVRLSNEEVDAAADNGGVISKAVDIIAPRGVVLTSDVVRVSIKVTPREAPANP
ncbi:MAG: hypothetical protein AAF085_10755 [Planctomycetota bacterium]